MTLKEKVMNVFHTHESITKKQLISLTGLSSADIEKILNELQGIGFVYKHGKGRGTTFRLQLPSGKKENEGAALPSQKDFIHHWIDTKKVARFKKIKCFSLSELPASRAKISKPLAKHIWEHHHDRKRLGETMKMLGYSSLAEVYTDQRPKQRDTRMGNFGEIVTSAFMEQQLDYLVPVYRLRYNPNPEQSMKGDDVIGFKFGEDGEKRGICVAESKARKHYDTEIFNEAYEGIKKVLI